MTAEIDIFKRVSDPELQQYLPATVCIVQDTSEDEKYEAFYIRHTRSKFYQTDFASCEPPYRPVSKTLNFDEIL